MKLISWVILLVLLATCSQRFQVHTMSDDDYDIRLYNTYRWQPVTDIESNNNPLYSGQLTFQKVKLIVPSLRF